MSKSLTKLLMLGEKSKLLTSLWVWMLLFVDCFIMIPSVCALLKPIFFQMQLWYGAPTVKSNHYNVDKRKKALLLAHLRAVSNSRELEKITRQLVSYERFASTKSSRDFDFSFILLYVYLLLESDAVWEAAQIFWCFEEATFEFPVN